MNLKIVFLLLVTTRMYCQDFVKMDTIKIDSKIYKTYHISYGNSSGLKLFKVMTCNSSNINKIKQAIINCNKNQKLEFTEFYIVSINNDKDISRKKEIDILIKFLEKIDTERMKLKLSTALIQSTFKIQDFTYEYLLDKPKKSLFEFEYYKLNITLKDVCNFIRK